MVPIDRIVPNPHQPRRTFTESNLRELAESIRANGVIQPLVVRKKPGTSTSSGGGSDSGSGGGAQYELIAGERRLRASKLAGLTEVPCHVKDVDELTQAQLALVENIQREDLNPVERAEGYRTLMTQLGLTQAELATRLGEDRSTIANFVRLLDLAEPVKRYLREGLLSVGHAKLLAGVNDVLEQERLAKLVLQQGLSVRNLEKVMLNSPAAAAPKAAEDGVAQAGRQLHYQELEKSIAQQLGLRVQVSAGKGKGKGRVVIHFGSLDQFDQLMERLNVEIK
jgi:ParB family chromosome partitioning protein